MATNSITQAQRELLDSIRWTGQDQERTIKAVQELANEATTWEEARDELHEWIGDLYGELERIEE